MDSFDNLVMNVNTVVEILIHYMDYGNWTECFKKCIPQRKVHDLEQEQEEFNVMRIKTEEQLLQLSSMKLTKFEFRKALERHCIKNGLNVTFEKQVNDLKALEKNGINIEGMPRFLVKAFINGQEVGKGEGSNSRIAASYASWRGLKWCGVYDMKD